MIAKNPDNQVSQSLYKALQALQVPHFLKTLDKAMLSMKLEDFVAGPLSSLLTEVENKHFSSVHRGRILNCLIRGIVHLASSRKFDTSTNIQVLLLPIGDSFQLARGELLYLFLMSSGYQVTYLAPNTEAKNIAEFLDSKKFPFAIVVHNEDADADDTVRQIGKFSETVIEYTHNLQLNSNSASSITKVVELLSVKSSGTFDDLITKLARRIKDIRKQKKLSQEKLAELADINRSFLSSLENGKVNPSLNLVYRLSQALETPIEILVESDPRER